jgi:hypothetical protein
MATEIIIEEKVYNVDVTGGSEILVEVTTNNTQVLVSNDQGPQGIQGPPATVNIGEVTTVDNGVPAAVTNSGTPTDAILDFELPEGPAATLEVGDVTTVAWDEPATVTNSGTTSDAIFDFELPRGRETTVTVGTVTTGAEGTDVEIVNSGDEFDAVLDFTIPVGDTGTAATISVGTVTTGEPESSASVINSGTPQDAVLNFSIPEGIQGIQGIAGPTGPTGPTGATGSTGPTGPTGPTGLGYGLTTSNQTITFNTGSVNFGNIGVVGAFVVGNRIRAASSTNPTTEWLEGVITGITNVIPNSLWFFTVNIDSFSGSGTVTRIWNIGITGLTGAIGATGATGATGPMGITGDMGPVGPQGEPGIDGNDGATGPTGIYGRGYGGIATWANFETGAPSGGLSVGNEFYYGFTNLVAYQVGDRVKLTKINDATKFFEGTVTATQDSSTQTRIKILISLVSNSPLQGDSYNASLAPGATGPTGAPGPTGPIGPTGPSGADGTAIYDTDQAVISQQVFG